MDDLRYEAPDSVDAAVSLLAEAGISLQDALTVMQKLRLGYCIH